VSVATSTPAYVTPQVLRWARESLGLELEEAATLIKVPVERLTKAEAGEGHLTLRQAERAAKVYDRNLAMLFLANPPEEEPQDALFRRLPGAPAPPWPPAMQLLARRVRARQDAAAELYEVLEEPPPWLDAVSRFAVDRHLLATVTRKELGVTFGEQTSWRDYQGYTPLRAWVDAVEALGVLVMQDGNLSVEEMRGFAAPHDSVPAIVVNTNDDPRARAFTVVHELGHLLLAALGEPTGSETEEWCDDFAGEVILPNHWLEREFAKVDGRDPLALVDEVALRFGITPLAAAVRLSRTELLDRRIVGDVIDRIRSRPPRARGTGGGGDYYRTMTTRLGPGFIRLVLGAAEVNALPLSNAAGLLGVKVNNFGRLRQTIESRTVFE
jgi:Zn-dependent peptidase ImmA (M78 family)/transcriptional regulator with XRE-family HTH domain